MLIRLSMTLKLVSEAGGQAFTINPKSFGKLLHLARLNGWNPERVSSEWPSDSWETEIILPHIEPYLSGRVSQIDAEGLRVALTRALATGAVAVEGTIQHASVTLLQVARAGAFRVCMTRSASLDPQRLFNAVPA